MGSSTGCQDIMEYLTGTGHESRPPIDGGILQAPVSDREALLMMMDPKLYRSSCIAARKMVDEGKGEEILSKRETGNAFPAPCTARRWLSLASPNHDGEDDYFSSDLGDERLEKSFGKLPRVSPLCVLMSEKDEYVPRSVDKKGVMERWVSMVKKGEGSIDEVNSGVVARASHNLVKDGGEIVGGLVTRVLGFLEDLPEEATSKQVEVKL